MNVTDHIAGQVSATSPGAACMSFATGGHDSTRPWNRLAETVITKRSNPRPLSPPERFSP